MSLTQVFTTPVYGRHFFEAVIRDNLDLGRPDRVSVLFSTRLRRNTRPPNFGYKTRVITRGVAPSLHIEFKHSHVKQYFKEERALRTETTINDPLDFQRTKALDTVPYLRSIGRQITPGCWRSSGWLTGYCRQRHSSSVCNSRRAHPLASASQRCASVIHASTRCSARCAASAICRTASVIATSAVDGCPLGTRTRQLQRWIHDVRPAPTSPAWHAALSLATMLEQSPAMAHGTAISASVVQGLTHRG
jgi:hypothetical protein